MKFAGFFMLLFDMIAKLGMEENTSGKNDKVFHTVSLAIRKSLSDITHRMKNS